MKVLVDKIEEYRTTEDTMRQTLLSAQKLAAGIEAEARGKAEEMLANAKTEAERITHESYTQRSTEEARLLEAKRESMKYIENMRAICSRQLVLDGLQNLKLEDMTQNQQPEKARAFDETVRSIETSVEKLAPAESEKPVREAPAETPVGEDEPTCLFRTGTAARPVRRPKAAPASALTISVLENDLKKITGRGILSDDAVPRPKPYVLLSFRGKGTFAVFISF